MNPMSTLADYPGIQLGGKNKDSGLNREIKFRLSETQACLNFSE
jgi:hypothetical protein